MADGKNRNKRGAFTAALGMALNLLLSAAKIAVGTIFGSVAVTGDGFNNLTDAGSSIVSLIGFRFSNKPADKDHPFGHARYEYIAGLIVAFIVLFLGLQLGRDSIEKLTAKGTSDPSIVMICVLAGSIAIKLFMFVFYRLEAKRIDSTALKAASVDSLNDVATTGAVLICTLIARFAQVEIDAYAGLAVAAFIIFNGVKLVKETASPLLGEKPDKELVKKIEEKILSYDGVMGIHDLMVHNYGPNRFFSSVHIEVDARVNVMESHELMDKIERDLAETGINIVAHMDPIIVDDERVDKMKALVAECLAEIDPTLKFHDFRLVWGENRINLIFDMVVPYGYKIKDAELLAWITERVAERDSRCAIVATVEKDYVGIE